LPFFYDVCAPVTSSATAGSEATNLWGQTVSASQETVGLYGLYLASRFGTAGGAQARIKTNTGAVATGGTAQTPARRNLRSPAASSVWTQGTVTAGGTLTTRMTVGFAQTGGMGGWVPITPQDAIQMMPDATNPVDVEVTGIATGTAVTYDQSLEIGEGI
jgi:hypothetical protein